MLKRTTDLQSPTYKQNKKVACNGDLNNVKGFVSEEEKGRGERNREGKGGEKKNKKTGKWRSET